MHGPVGIDDQGELTTPKVELWCDKRCEPQVSEVSSNPESLKMPQKPTANPPSPSWSAFKVMWEKFHRRESYEATVAYLMPKDYINSKLTGVIASDHSEMSLSYVYYATEQAYSEELAQILNAELAKFPPIYESFQVIGHVTHEASLATGLPQGVPVVAGEGDFVVFLLGVGL
jgi:xylulokinase